MLRTLAEMENLRKRTAKEVADSKLYGVTGFARDVLDIADNLQRALDAIPAETRAAADPGMTSLIEGVELTERSLLNALEKHGVKKFDPQGQKFDPNFQQAMYEVPDASVPAGTVVQVMQAGYTIGERVLRPALVGVAKGGAKAAPREQQRGERALPTESDPHGSGRRAPRMRAPRDEGLAAFGVAYALTAISADWIRFTPALAMSAQAFASEP